MKDQKMKTLLVSALLLSCLFIADSHTDKVPNWAKTHVRLFNKSEKQGDMTEQCWSSEDDLGYHTVRFNEYYEFTFRPNFWGSTKFMCKVMFNNDGQWKYFYGYMYWRDSRVCAAQRQCDWDVSEARACRFDGFCVQYT